MILKNVILLAFSDSLEHFDFKVTVPVEEVQVSNHRAKAILFLHDKKSFNDSKK